LIGTERKKSNRNTKAPNWVSDFFVCAQCSDGKGLDFEEFAGALGVFIKGSFDEKLKCTALSWGSARDVLA
jgi:hypothetical protein